MSCTNWVFSADISEWCTDGYPIASGREQEEGLVDLPWYGFAPWGDGGYVHLSESCCPCYFSLVWSPMVGLRLGTLPKCCRGHCPWRTCSICCLLLAGVTCNNHQISETFPPPSVPRQELHHHPCVTAALLCDPPGFTKRWEAGEAPQQQQERAKWPFLHPVCSACPWIRPGWAAQRAARGSCAWPQKSELC